MHAEHLNAAKPRGVPRTQLSSSRPGGADYRAHRPTVERSWPTCCAAATAAEEPGCEALCGSPRIWWLLAAVNLARFAVLGV
jgi:hypothetical protein